MGLSKRLRKYSLIWLALFGLPVLACNLVVIRIPPSPFPTITPVELPTTNVILPGDPLTVPLATESGVAPTVTLTPTAFMTQTPGPTQTPLPTLAIPYADATNLLVGVCFKYLATLDGQNINFASSGDLAAFYNDVNKSKKCADAAPFTHFDFSTQQLVGTVITGQGCDIALAYDRTDQDDAAKQRRIVMHSSITGDCPYLLVQPILIVIDRKPGYQTKMVIVK